MPIILKKEIIPRLDTTTTTNDITTSQHNRTTPLELDSTNNRLDWDINTVA